MELGCFCHQSLATLARSMASLGMGLDAAAELPLLPGAQRLLALSAFLDARGLPAPAWSPDPAWLTIEAQLAPPPLGASAMATIALLAQARAQAQASLGFDLLEPGQAVPFRRIVATLSARIAAMATALAGQTLPWIRLAALDRAVVQVRGAILAGQFSAVPAANAAPASWTLPETLPWPRWQGLLAKVQGMAPLLAACLQLGITIEAGFSAKLATALRTLRQVTLPVLPQTTVAAELTAALAAVAQLRASLGVDPLTNGYAAIEGRVRARLAAVLPVLPSLPAPLSPAPEPRALPPPMAGSLATPAVMRALAAMPAQETAAMAWQVPIATELSLVAQGLPALALIVALREGLSLDPVRAAPCAHGCDAAALARLAA